MRNTHKISQANYYKVHYWLRKNHGKASKCEGENCSEISKDFEWALLKGKRYAKNRENFIQLCKSCHSKYDFTETARKKMSKLAIERGLNPNKFRWKENRVIDNICKECKKVYKCWACQIKRKFCSKECFANAKSKIMKGKILYNPKEF